MPREENDLEEDPTNFGPDHFIEKNDTAF